MEPEMIQSCRVSRRGALVGLSAAALSSTTGRSRAAELDKLSYHTGWRAQAESGGFYQAVATGIYRDHGIDLELRQGGPQLDLNAQFLAGRVDLIETNAFAALNYVKENLPGVTIAAFMQKDPRILVSHPDVGNDTLPALKGKTILIATSGRFSYWQWLKAKYGFADDQARPYTFNLAPFLADKMVSVQGLATSEPFDIRRAGIEPVIHLLADHGFENYQSMVLASPKMIAEKAELLQRFVDASIKGWASYLNGDPGPGNALIKRDNPDMTDEKIAFSIDAMRKFGIMASGDATTLGLGAMTEKRWHDFYTAMVDCGAQPPGLDLSKIYTLQFVNKRVGL
jgi:NitT/TauT family transport system substrate-binding protein